MNNNDDNLIKKTNSLQSQGNNKELHRCRFLTSFNIGRYEFDEDANEDDKDKDKEVLQVARRKSLSAQGGMTVLENSVESILNTIELRKKSLWGENPRTPRSARKGRNSHSANLPLLRDLENGSKRLSAQPRRRTDREVEIASDKKVYVSLSPEALILERLKRQSIERRTRRLVELGWSKSNHEDVCFNYHKTSLDRRCSWQIQPTPRGYAKAMEGRRVLAEERKSREKYDNRLRRICRALSMMLRLGNLMKIYSMSLIVDTAAMEAWRQIQSEEDTSFRKSNFSTEKKSYSYVPVWAKSIFNKAPELRTDFEISSIHALMRELDSFDKFTHRIQMAICRVLQYVNLESGRVILRKGHVGYNFYFIFSGSVFVNIENASKQQSGQAWRTIAVLQRGDCFGEVALLRSVHRTATVAVRERAELLAVDRETFVNTCPAMLNQELKEKMSFCRNLLYFKPWSDEHLQDICFDSRIRYYEVNKVIVADSSEEKDWIYICMEGKCMVIRGVSINKTRASSCRGRDPKKSLSATRQRSYTYDSNGDHRGGSVQKNEQLRQILLEKRQADLEDNESSSDEDTFGDEVGIIDSKSRLMKSGEKSLEKLKTQDKRAKDKNGQFIGSIKKNIPRGDKRKISSSNEESETSQDGGIRPRSISIVTFINAMKMAKDNVTFLRFRTISRGGVFDSEGILDHFSRSFMLVSLGAKLLKIKTGKLLKFATKPYLRHWEEVAQSEGYPQDKELRKAFSNQEHWTSYKADIMKGVILENKGIDVVQHSDINQQQQLASKFPMRGLSRDGSTLGRPISSMSSRSQKNATESQTRKKGTNLYSVKDTSQQGQGSHRKLSVLDDNRVRDERCHSAKSVNFDI